MRRPWMLLSLCLPLLLSACAPGTTNLAGALKPNPQPVSEAEAAAALEVAREHVGTPYTAAGRGPTRFDSSGIITYAYRQVIPSLRFRTSEWDASYDAPHRLIYYWNLEALPVEDLAPGDLVYLTDGTDLVTHGAFFVEWVEPYEVMRFLDASGFHGEVGVQEWPVHEAKRGQWLVGAGRLQVVRGPEN